MSNNKKKEEERQRRKENARRQKELWLLNYNKKQSTTAASGTNQYGKTPGCGESYTTRQEDERRRRQANAKRDDEQCREAYGRKQTSVTKKVTLTEQQRRAREQKEKWKLRYEAAERE